MGSALESGPTSWLRGAQRLSPWKIEIWCNAIFFCRVATGHISLPHYLAKETMVITGEEQHNNGEGPTEWTGKDSCMRKL
jgi:hypothetical protein